MIYLKAKYLLMITFILAAGSAAGIFTAHKMAVPVSAPVEINDVYEKLVLSAAGDCTLGYDESFGYDGSFNDLLDKAGGDFSYFFSNVYELFSEDDITIVNLEGDLTDSTTGTVKAYNFRGSPDYVNILKSGSVEVVNIANNHTYDFGEEGYQDTIKTLREANISFFGNSHTYLAEINNVKIGFAGFEIWYDDMDVRKKIKNAINSLRAEGADIVIMSFHWGIEGDYVPYDVQKAIGRYAVDCGADAVLGHHPHVIQGIEEYNGKQIVYSMGNFCFGGNKNPRDKDCYIFRLSYEIKNGALTGNCESTVIPCSVSSVPDYNDYRPTPAKGDEYERIMDKINKHSDEIN